MKAGPLLEHASHLPERVEHGSRADPGSGAGLRGTLRERDRSMLTLQVLLLVAASSEAPLTQAATTQTEASLPVAVATGWHEALTALLNEADRQHGLQARHLEAAAIEKALQMLPERDPRRRELARRVAAVYRSGMGHYERAGFWLRMVADELRPTPDGIDALFDLADTCFNHGEIDEALAIYREILKRIVPPTPPYDIDGRCWRAWHGEDLSETPLGSEPLFPSDVAVRTRVLDIARLARNRSWGGIQALLDEHLPLRSMVQPKGDSKSWISLRSWVRGVLASLPNEGLHLLTDAYERKLAELDDRHDWRAAAEFRLLHPIPAIESRLDRMIGDQLLEQGLPDLASLYFGRILQDAGKNADAALLAKELFSRIHAGETVQPESAPAVEIEVGGETRSLRDCVASWGGSGAEATTPVASLDVGKAVITRVPVLRATSPLLHWQARWHARNWDDVFTYLDEFIPCIPAGSARHLIVNMGDAIEAVDLIEGHMTWSFLPPEENPMPQPAQKFQSREAYIMCGKSKTAVVSGGRVFCHLLWGHHDTARDAGALFALRESDGAMLWSSLYVPELAGTQIAADPAVYRGVVVASAWRPRVGLPMFFVVGMSAETGELLWLNHLFSGGSMVAHKNEQFLDLPAATCPPTIVDGVAYVSTGAGVVAAVDVIDGITLWATEYPRARAINQEEWAVRMATSRPPGVVAVFPDVVLFAPVDAHLLLAIERTTGRIRYMQKSLDLRAIAASDRQRAYVVAGTTVRAINPADGETVWERQLPTAGLVGLPTLTPRGLICPSWERLHVLDPVGGGVRTERSWTRAEACSYVQDFGDLLVGASRTGLHIMADREFNDTHERWLSPEFDRQPETVRVPSRADKWLAWAMPGMVNRGDFVLSDSDPDHFLVQADLLQMRALDPVPTLRWERLSPLPWSSQSRFSSQWVVVWDAKNVFVLDAATGQQIWEDHPLPRLGRPVSAARILPDAVQVLLGPKEGEETPSAPTSLCVVFDGRSARDRLLCEADGLPWPEDPPKGRRFVPEGPEPPRWVQSDGYHYEFSKNRIRAIDLWDTRELWQTPTIVQDVRFIAPLSGAVVALTQAYLQGDVRFRDMAHIQIFDRDSGERIESVRLLKRWQHQFEHRDDRLMTWDINFLYYVRTVESQIPPASEITICQERPDPDAIAALRLARDLAQPPRAGIGTLRAAPHIDAAFSDWSGVDARRLESVMDWRPDFVHRSREKSRSYGGRDDLSADIRLAWTGDDLCIAATVIDDVHHASPGPGIWRSDSLTLQFGEPRGETVDPCMLTVALVGGVVRLELGNAVMTAAVSAPAGRLPDVGSSRDRFTLGTSAVGGILPVQIGVVIEAAARRSESLHRTWYELRVPRAIVRPDAEVYWDLLVNENDGLGREGALQLASSVWSIEESQTASLRGGE